MRTDTLQKTEQTAKEPNPSSSASSSSSSSSPSSYDNMRGFDPASENDMEDNGMSRFMENNDEEGWDWCLSTIDTHNYLYNLLDELNS